MIPELLPLAQSAALAAGRVLVAERPAVLAAGMTTTKSSATDPVTSADLAAQRVIAEAITTARPGDAITGEEGLSQPGQTGVRWIVDPLDGTVNYLYGRDEWAVSIAAVDQAGAAVAVVHSPALRRTYTAIRAQGAWLDGQPLAVRPATELSSAVIGTGFSYTADGRDAQAAILARLLPRIADIRRTGSAALDLAAVAGGTLDAFYENDLEEWDWAAGALIAAEAGATVSPLPGPGRRSGVLAAGPALRDELLALVMP